MFVKVIDHNTHVRFFGDTVYIVNSAVLC